MSVEDDELLPRDPDAVIEGSGRALRRSHENTGYAAYGDPDGDPVVLAHPTPGTRRFGRLLADEAANLGVLLVVPERPGYGNSALRTLVGPFTTRFGLGDVTSQAGVTRGVLDALDAEEAGVVGVSTGCPFALALAVECPGLVGELALVSPTTPPDGPGEDVPVRRGLRDLGSTDGADPEDRVPGGRPSVPFWDRTTPLDRLHHRREPLSEREAASLYGDPDRLSSVAPTLRSEVTAAIAEPATGYETEKRLLGREWGVDFEAVDADPIVLNGTEDDYTPPETGRYLARRLDGAAFGKVEGEGHLSTLLSTAGTVLRHAAPTLSTERDPTSRGQT